MVLTQAAEAETATVACSSDRCTFAPLMSSQSAKAISVKPAGKVDTRVIDPGTWPDAFGFVQANLLTGANQILMCAGQLPVHAEGHAGG